MWPDTCVGYFKVSYTSKNICGLSGALVTCVGLHIELHNVRGRSIIGEDIGILLLQDGLSALESQKEKIDRKVAFVPR